jgi:hypothetical protein
LQIRIDGVGLPSTKKQLKTYPLTRVPPTSNRHHQHQQHNHQHQENRQTSDTQTPRPTPTTSTQTTSNQNSQHQLPHGQPQPRYQKTQPNLEHGTTKPENRQPLSKQGTNANEGRQPNYTKIPKLSTTRKEGNINLVILHHIINIQQSSHHQQPTEQHINTSTSSAQALIHEASWPENRSPIIKQGNMDQRQPNDAYQQSTKPSHHQH